MHILNNKTGSQRSPNRRRTIFKGFYEFDIEVAIQKIENKVELRKEIERETRILRELDNDENFIRYFCFEEDIKKDFV